MVYIFRVYFLRIVCLLLTVSRMSVASGQEGGAPLPSTVYNTNPMQQWEQSQAGQNQVAPSQARQNLSPPSAPVANNNAFIANPPSVPDNNPFLETQSSLPPVPPSPPHASNYVKEQQAMVNSIPQGRTPPTIEDIIAFNNMMKQNMPLSPQQVVQLHQQVDLAQRAAAVPPNVPPKPVSTTLMVNLAPGTTPPAVRLAQGYVSSLVFVDSTGSPWPIAAFDVGNPKAVTLQWDGKSNILLLQAISPYSDGDIVVRLVGLPTPVTLELVSGQRVVDYRVDIHVSGIGPNTKDLPMGTALPNNANQLLLGVLDGVAPAGGKLLSVRGAECQAWQLGETIYLRTRLTVLSPGWMGKMVSPDGMQAYELPKTSSVLVSRYGEPAELKIEGF
jgi:intracellular multiplication protein IcmK